MLGNLVNVGLLRAAERFGDDDYAFRLIREAPCGGRYKGGHQEE